MSSSITRDGVRRADGPGRGLPGLMTRIFAVIWPLTQAAVPVMAR